MLQEGITVGPLFVISLLQEGITVGPLFVISLFQEGITVGPLSVAYKLKTEALVFGGKTMTSTDIAVASGLCNIGDKERIKDIPKDVRVGAMAEIKRKIEAAVDRVKVSVN